MRKIISILLVIVTLFSITMLTGCSLDANDIAKELMELEQQMQEEAQKAEDNKDETETDDIFIKHDEELRQMVNADRSIKEEIDWDLAANEDRGTGDVLKFWTEPLAFDGFQGAGANVQFMSFVPDDCYFSQSLNIDAIGEKYIDYRLNFFEDYSQINIDSISLKLDGIFGINVDKETLTSIIESYKVKLAENAEKDKVIDSYILYDENDVVVKISAINNNDTNFIAVVGYYINPHCSKN